MDLPWIEVELPLECLSMSSIGYSIIRRALTFDKVDQDNGMENWDKYFGMKSIVV